MALTYQPTFFRRLRDRLMKFALRKGVGPPGIYLLIVPGRTTGTMWATPVAPLESDDGRWLVAAYGEVNWVHNARAAKRVSLQRGSTTESLAVNELEPAEAAPILKQYVAEHPRTVAPYFDTGKDAALTDFEAEVARHPVFKLVDDRRT
jgi:deazaflavin-dependent oxidoreductase (nitroreductase family)